MNALRLKKPKNARTRRVLKAREPQWTEIVKQAVLVCGHQHSQMGKDALKDLQRLKHLESVLLSRRHIGLAPFEDGGEIYLEKLSQKHDAGFFVVANHTKSKPHNLVFGRFYDHRIYDMVELGIEHFTSLDAFAAQTKIPEGTKPCFVFLGNQWEADEKLKLLKNLFLDFFQGRVVEGVVFEGLERWIVLTAKSSEQILFRQFKVTPQKQMRKSVLEDFVEIGPRLDFVLRRSRDAPEGVKRQAMQKQSVSKKRKNVKIDRMQNKVGAVYVPEQNIDSIITARHKGFKRQKRADR